eukprot:CAMPEP_0175104348 /NCGR_PEP_ID=MMETSP0086_2-20121207/9675_1 /TAXON_ID=136419 /ORGANISM="Unknown Unknown, Strain D1" /LENGTH=102 /DNA_ID=CAMNT_0016379725 /DNA_START=46 /DNA_END=354 /DNA_ORIENTATION=+
MPSQRLPLELENGRTVDRQFEDVPPFHEVDPRDVLARGKAIWQSAREEAVYLEHMHAYHDMLRRCYRINQVNHHKECRDDAIQYLRYLERYNQMDFSYLQKE